MNREDEFELRLAEWLEEGPFAAPDHVTDTAIEQARTHPRRRPVRVAFWRIAMNETHAASLAPRHSTRSHMLAVGLAAVVIVALVTVSAALLLGGRGFGLTPAPAAAPPSMGSGPVEVTATEIAADVQAEGTETTTPDGIHQLRGMRFTLNTTAASDQRIAGPIEVLLNQDTDVDYDSVFNAMFTVVPTSVWGTMTLTGRDGTWTGSFAGLVEGGLTGSATHHAAAVLLGTGAYQGLEYRPVMISGDGTNYQASGVIEPVSSATPQTASNPQVTGDESCEKPVLGPASTEATDVFGRTILRNATATCSMQTNDPRVNGTEARTFSSDPVSNETVTWGASEIANAGGTWSGVFVTLSYPAATAFAYIGGGGYAGLRYHGGGNTGLTPCRLTAAIEPVS